MFSSDPESRKLVVRTDEDTAKYISMVISNLDRPKPQVLIKVVFMEVSYTKGSDIGVEGSLVKKFGGGGSSSTGIVNQVFGSGLLSQAPSALAPGAGLYTVLGNDFQATLRAIAQAGKTEILSRPSILARNNQQATISIGQQVPLITGTQISALGTQSSSVSYANVGIILQVTPFITSDGLVEMIVSPQTSELADRAQWVATGNGVSAPVINSRSADTVVVVPDGQPVVIGGMMKNQKLQSDSKIPILGDIPLLGAAFKRKITDNVKTELLIFLTPHIVRDPVELAQMTQKERGDQEMVPKSFSEQELDKFLDGVPVKDPSTIGLPPPEPAKPKPNSKRR
ncbi:MAG: hypothetical protein FJ398_03855 [Verrucomicrobia bacterium]|nr:hypothetical protein [Verrucomicrobiota bacterium]